MPIHSNNYLQNQLYIVLMGKSIVLSKINNLFIIERAIVKVRTCKRNRTSRSGDACDVFLLGALRLAGNGHAQLSAVQQRLNISGHRITGGSDAKVLRNLFPRTGLLTEGNDVPFRAGGCVSLPLPVIEDHDEFVSAVLEYRFG